MNHDVSSSDCWTRGGTRLVYQHCAGCGRQWLFQRPFCPHCGRQDPEHRAFAGTGTVCASTLVHRAPDDVFRALAPYRLVLVDLDEGLRLMAHADADVRVGQRVRGEVRRIADRAMPYFIQDPSP
ncbi:MAG: OB-fold domain-containing protein [Rubrivivax sp.]